MAPSLPPCNVEIMTSAAIEAKSLSSLITLAEEPPFRPQNARLEPLVLYIARVPGSRDVFLSPIKPRQKMVTAEDVESCLYYLHVSSPDDETLLEYAATELEPVEEQPPPLPVRPYVHPSAQSALPDPLRAGLPQLQHHPLPPIPPYPLEDGPPQLNGYVPASQRTAMPQRKPVGHTATKPAANGALGVPQRPYLAQRPTMNSTASGPDVPPEVTLIRRNPVTGEQWNVGTIADPPVFDIISDNGRRGSMTSRRIRKSGQPLYLNITNPGYAKFGTSTAGSQPQDITRDTTHDISPDSSTPSLTVSNGTTGTVDTTSSEPSFHRRMWLEGSLFEKKAASHRKSVSADQPYQDHFSHSYRDSTFGSESTASYLDPPEVRRSSLVGDSKRANTKGYTFFSPWDGRCEFASGTMGNSLKCRHLWQKNSLNPMGNMPTQVSELRFNLPGGGPLASEPRQRSPPKPTVAEKHSKRSRLLAKFSDRHSTSYDAMPHIEARASAEYIDDSDMKLDLSLGQELAGGGFAGKQAKLGKLIIEAEGLSMLDLIVAANMALWFRAYEKSHS